MFFVFCLFCLSLFGSFYDFLGEVLTLLFFLHHENGDFSILMKDIVRTKVLMNDVLGRTF